MSLVTVARSRQLLIDRARSLAQRPHTWPVTPRFDPTRRWYARIATSDDAEAWLLTWLPGQHTDWHDHGDSAGAFVVVSGRITEELPGPRGKDFATGSGRSFGVRHVHRVANNGVDPAITIHVYAPALTAMTRYEIASGVLRASAVQRAGRDW
jgi:mannose-6-phosphate isomerase-like protein (cupin superfamily)